MAVVVVARWWCGASGSGGRTTHEIDEKEATVRHRVSTQGRATSSKEVTAASLSGVHGESPVRVAVARHRAAAAAAAAVVGVAVVVGAGGGAPVVADAVVRRGARVVATREREDAEPPGRRTSSHFLLYPGCPLGEAARAVALGRRSVKNNSTRCKMGVAYVSKSLAHESNWTLSVGCSSEKTYLRWRRDRRHRQRRQTRGEISRVRACSHLIT